MQLGEKLMWEGRAYIVRGFTPMSVPERRVLLDDAKTGRRIWASLADVQKRFDVRPSSAATERRNGHSS
jgi:hypothetical protein